MGTLLHCKINLDGPRPILTLIALIFTVACNNSKTIFINEPLPSENIKVNANAPGAPDGRSPFLTQFWTQDRRSIAPAGLGAFSQIDAQIVDESEHFIIYRQTTGSASANCGAGFTGNPTTAFNSSDSSYMLDRLEDSYNALREFYGGGLVPDVQGTGRIVILVYCIQDDFDDTGAFIAGYFAPRDLFSDRYTTALSNNLTLIQQTDAATIAERQGRSNENNIFYLDLDPLMSARAYGGDKIRARAQAAETAIHELSHMFTYNKRVRSLQYDMHDLWITEGIAEQAPALNGGLMTGQMERMQQYGLPVIQAYLGLSPSLFEFGSDDTTTENAFGAQTSLLAAYLQTNLFFNYLRHRSPRQSTYEQLYREINFASDPGPVGLNNALQNTLGLDFRSLYLDWVLASYIWSTGRYLDTFVDYVGGSDMAVFGPLSGDASPRVNSFITNNPLYCDNGTSPATDTIPECNFFRFRQSYRTSEFADRQYRWSYLSAGIGRRGTPGVAFPNKSTPVGFGDVCLRPASYHVTAYTPSPVEDNATARNPNGSDFPDTASGADNYVSYRLTLDPGLELYVAVQDAISIPGDALQIARYQPDSNNQVFINFLTQKNYNVIVINPESSGACKKVNQVMVEGVLRNRPTIPSNGSSYIKYVGKVAVVENPEFGWRSTPGATQGYAAGFYFAPEGTSAVTEVFDHDGNTLTPPRVRPLLFSTDTIVHVVNKHAITDVPADGWYAGQFLGRLGRRELPGDCALDDGNDFFKIPPNPGGTTNNAPDGGLPHCKSQFRIPRDVQVVPIHQGHPLAEPGHVRPYYLIVADQTNLRLARRTASGRFAGFIGHPSDPNRFYPRADNPAADPVPIPNNAGMPAAGYNITSVFYNYVPRDLELEPMSFPEFDDGAMIGGIDTAYEAALPDFAYLYILDVGQGRIIRRRLDLRPAADFDYALDGRMEGIFGNGFQNWSLSSAPGIPPAGGVTVGSPFSLINNPGATTAIGFLNISGLSGIGVDAEYLYITESRTDQAQGITRFRRDTGSHSCNTSVAGYGCTTGAEVYFGGKPGWQSFAALDAAYRNRGFGPYQLSAPADILSYPDPGPDNLPGTGDDVRKLVVADLTNNRLVRFAADGLSYDGWLGAGLTSWEADNHDEANFNYNCPSNPLAVVGDICFPISLSYYSYFSNTTANFRLPTIFTATQYGARVSRMNIRCINQNEDLLACQDP